MAVSMIGPKFYAWNRDGKPLAFGKLYTYQARTNVPKPTYQSEDQVVENTNPVILNGEGYANVYLDGSYKMVLKDKDENEIWSSDPVTSNIAEEWVGCVTAGYVSPTSFEVTGNLVESFEEERRVRLNSNSQTYSYSTIKSAVYSNGKTIVTIRDPEVTTGILEVCISIVGYESSPVNKDSIGFYCSYYFSSISDALDFKTKDGTVLIQNGSICSISSYSDGWAATSEGPKGGGLFVFDEGSMLDDGVVNFLSSDSSGSFRRHDSNEVDFSWAGGRVDNSDTDNDDAVEKIIAYCASNEKGFRIKGTHEVTKGFDTTNVDFIAGYHRDHDGFKLNASAGKTFILWERPTVLRDLKIEGSSTSTLIDEGSIGVSRAPYLNRMERVRIQNWGNGFHYHSSVDCHCKQVWVGGCHIGVKLDGYDPSIAVAFSTTGSFTDSEFHGNYDGVVVGSMGAFNTAFIGFNFHNTIFEKNSHIGLVCTNVESEGVVYSSLELRNLVFTGYVWFEQNLLMYDLTRCQGVSWNGQVRNENNQPFKDNSDPTRSSRYGTSGLVAGNINTDNPYNCKFKYNGVEHIYGGFYSPNEGILNFKSFTDESTLAGGIELRQKLDWSAAGRLTELGFYVRAEADSEAVEKMTLSRQGNLTITGSYSPFTGVHFFHSDTFINSGMSVKGDSFDKIECDNFIMEGSCSLTCKADDAGCLGVVDYCEKISDGYLIAVAAVGDNSTLSMEGAVVSGDFSIGDYLSTSDVPGQLRVYNGDSMKPVVMQVKGDRKGLAYGYFK